MRHQQVISMYTRIADAMRDMAMPYPFFPGCRVYWASKALITASERALYHAVMDRMTADYEAVYLDEDVQSAHPLRSRAICWYGNSNIYPHRNGGYIVVLYDYNGNVERCHVARTITRARRLARFLAALQQRGSSDYEEALMSGDEWRMDRALKRHEMWL